MLMPTRPLFLKGTLAWALPQQDLDLLMAARAGAAPDIVYAREVPADPSPDIDVFNKKDCSLILIEVGFCRDLACHQKYTEKTDKYPPYSASFENIGDESSSFASPSVTLAPPSSTTRTTSHPPSPRTSPPSPPNAKGKDTRRPTRARPPSSTTRGSR